MYLSLPCPVSTVLVTTLSVCWVFLYGRIPGMCELCLVGSLAKWGPGRAIHPCWFFETSREKARDPARDKNPTTCIEAGAENAFTAEYGISSWLYVFRVVLCGGFFADRGGGFPAPPPALLSPPSLSQVIGLSCLRGHAGSCSASHKTGQRLCSLQITNRYLAERSFAT